MNLEKKSLKILEKALAELERGFSRLPDFEREYDFDAMEKVIIETAREMTDNYPYFHPLYAGQMLKPPHPAARIAYMLSLWINPNNHALDGGRASSRMEKEAVAEIADIFGWKNFLGHLTSGGTMANLEALWVAGLIAPDKKIVASEMAHYTHSRISSVLGLRFESLPCDNRARMDLNALEDALKKGDVGTVVATLGTTGPGTVDPLADILKLKDEYGFRVHVDAAYGGYFILADNLDPETRENFECVGHADSIVVDPHKHGLQPYGCGCVLYKDPSVGRFYKHDSPYTYFTSDELHLGEISLECSRAGASATALWATQKLLPMVRGGEFARGLEKGRQAALALYRKISENDYYMPIFEPELDILVWAPVADNAGSISDLSEKIFRTSADMDLHLAVFKYPARLLEGVWENVEFDREHVTCLRACMMKPEHEDWVDNIWSILKKVEKRISNGC